MKLLIIAMLTASLFLIGCSGEATNYDDLAQCLTDKGAVMYGTEWCSHCQNQKKAFGDSFQYIDFVDCDQSRDKCLDAGIQGYPTWKIEGVNYPGEQSLDRLAGLAGC
jgi:hypothetical protein